MKNEYFVWNFWKLDGKTQVYMEDFKRAEMFMKFIFSLTFVRELTVIDSNFRSVNCS